MKKKIVFSFILGILISSVAYAAVSISSDKISYNDTTVKDSLDNLFDESVNGKNNIISALSNKGFNVTNNSTYSEIVNGINELPVTIGKDEEGNYGYYKDDSLKLFESDIKYELIWTNPSPNSVFPAQTINLDLSEYDSIIVKMKYMYTWGAPYTYGYINVNDSNTLMAANGEPKSSGVAWATFRYCSVTKSSVVFGPGGYNAGFAYPNDVAIPVEIYGVNVKLPSLN